jgi:cytochrome c-type biogenesis protein
MCIQSAITAFLVGLAATVSPCVLPLYPGFLAYLSGGSIRRAGKGRYFLGGFVLAGVLVMMLALGGLIAVASAAIGQVLTLIIPLADLLLLILGGLLVCNVNPFTRLPQVQIPLLSHPFAGAFVYGLLYGPLTLPCSGALVVGIFAFSISAGAVLGKLALFLWFGLGFGLPLLGLSLIAGTAQRRIVHLAARGARWVNLAGGLLLLGLGVYNLALNWESFRLMIAIVLAS